MTSTIAKVVKKTISEMSLTTLTTLTTGICEKSKY